jgi:AGCS family alanine or glycine:cation symporter
MNAIIDFINNILWSYVLLYGLLAAGLYFTIRLRFIQFVHIGEFFRVAFRRKTEDAQGISPFQALMVSLASRVGTGNIAGVAVALYLGGPGAIFWMWIVALLGMATAYSESSLAQLFKIRAPEGYRGGPAFYISKGLGLPWLAAIFSVCLLISFGLVFNAVQTNSMADAFSTAFNIPHYATGLIVAALAGIVIFGGIRQIARVAEILVPFMAVAYILMAVYVVLTNLHYVPVVFGAIFRSAFGLDQAIGGIFGGMAAAMLNGVKRGLFSNEAGMGSAPNIAAAATPSPHHPSSQGFVQAFGVVIDTLLVCSATAFMILIADVLKPGSGVTGIQLTQQAMQVHLGSFGKYFIAIAIACFAFTSIIGNYSYAESSLVFLKQDSKLKIAILRFALMGMVFWGAVQSIQTVFNFADASMGLMATINLIAIILLSNIVVKLTRDYFAQRKAGKDPRFDAHTLPEVVNKVDTTIWKP